MALPYQNRIKRVSHRSPYTTQPICIRKKEIAKHLALAPSAEGRANTWMPPRLLSNARLIRGTSRHVRVASEVQEAARALHYLLLGLYLVGTAQIGTESASVVATCSHFFATQGRFSVVILFTRLNLVPNIAVRCVLFINDRQLKSLMADAMGWPWRRQQVSSYSGLV